MKAACIHCRRDKIQCETERPCRGCVRRGLQCLDRTCACAEKGRGHECAICRAQRAQGESSIHNCKYLSINEGDGLMFTSVHFRPCTLWAIRLLESYRAGIIVTSSNFFASGPQASSECDSFSASAVLKQ